VDPFAWWNLLFELPIAGACLMALLSAAGVDAAAEGDGHADHDVPQLPAGDTHLPDSAHDGHHDAHHAGWLSVLLALPGADRAPLSLVLLVLGLGFGVIGLALNHVLHPLLPVFAFVPLSLAGATAGGLLASRTMARAFGRFIPRLETYVTSRKDCVGQVATVTNVLSDGQAYAQVYDKHRNLLEVRVSMREGRASDGAKVLLLDWDEGNGHFVADPAGPLLEATAGHDQRVH
jgi:hypothetical protein